MTLRTATTSPAVNLAVRCRYGRYPLYAPEEETRCFQDQPAVVHRDCMVNALIAAGVLPGDK